jgi:WD40 repeat protein
MSVVPLGLTALLGGLFLAATYLVSAPEQEEPKSLTNETLRGHRDQVHAAAFAIDGRTLAWNHSAGGLTLWDLEHSHERATLRRHSGWISSIAFAPDAKTLASGGSDGTIRLWDLSKLIVP